VRRRRPLRRHDGAVAVEPGRPVRRAPPTAVAVVLERTAVLLGAGVAPASAWRHLAGSERHAVVAAVAERVGTQAARGSPVSVALLDALRSRPFARVPDGLRADREWRQVACAWRVAEQSGAPLADCLRSFARALRQSEEVRHEVEVALAGPRAAARIVLGLPVVGLLFSLGSGVDAGAVLVSPLGGACLAGGGALVAAARAWNARLVRGATPPGDVPGLRLELLAVALAGGGSWQGAVALVARAVEECLVDGPSGDDDGAAALELSRRAGAPAAELLRAAAVEERLEAATTARSAAARLGSTLMLPLGACVLPAFLLVGVVPLVAALVSSTAGVL